MAIDLKVTILIQQKSIAINSHTRCYNYNKLCATELEKTKESICIQQNSRSCNYTPNNQFKVGSLKAMKNLDMGR